MKILVIQVAALGHDLWEKHAKANFWKKLETQASQTVFPAVTCPVQASFRTASLPSSHGMIANGIYNRELRKVLFWEQSSNLYAGERIWSEFRESGGRVGQVCWQQSLGTDSDLILSPAPVHKHHGGMIQDCYSRPSGLYHRLCSEIGRKFNLFNYWGPFTSLKSTRWIADATASILKDSEGAPDLLLTYLPHLDYDLQRHGPDSPKAAKIFAELEIELEKLLNSANQAGYETFIFGDYAITNASEALFPNKTLRENCFFTPREVSGRLYHDFHCSKAFAMVDHQVAHIFVQNDCDIEVIKGLFINKKGIARVSTPDKEKSSAGELVLEAESGYWFAYPWWEKSSEAPDYASHVDIHNKPGFDPCELFMGLWPPFSVNQDTSKIRGTHGLANLKEHDIFWGSTLKQEPEIESIIDGASLVKSLLSTSSDH